MSKSDYLGLVVGIILFILIFIAIDVKKPKTQPITPKSNFEVVDEYKGCDVVRWTQSNFAQYKYFLHCNNTRPVYEK